MDKILPVTGIALVIGICWLFSENRNKINWKTVLSGLTLQIVLAVLVIRGETVSRLFNFLPFNEGIFFWLLFAQISLLIFVLRSETLTALRAKIPARPVAAIILLQAAVYILKYNVTARIFMSVSEYAAKLLQYSAQGASFVFGPLGSSVQMKDVFSTALGEKVSAVTVIFAFQILPTIIFVASLFAILYYLGIMQFIVKKMAVGMNKVMAASGAESLDVAANIFMGQTEAPLTILPYLPKLTRSELFTVMVSGMSHTSAGILLAYSAVSGADPKHLLTSVIMTAPGAIMIAKLLIPETRDTSQRDKEMQIELNAKDNTVDKPVNVIDAAARGAGQGLSLAANVGAMLIAFIAIIALINGIFSGIKDGMLSASPGSIVQKMGQIFPAGLEQLLGMIFSPIVFMAGVPWKEATDVGQLLGTRIALNEFVAYVKLGAIKSTLSEKSFLISTYMLCGFGNLSSIAIQTGGIGALVPSRRAELAELGMRAVLAGTLTNLLAATIVGVLF